MFELPLRRELPIALGGPIVIMGLNQCALVLFARGATASVWQAAACLALFIPIVAATSVICGRFLHKWLRWIVFSWTLVALDLMIFVVGGSPMRDSSTAEMLACAMISGQLGALVVWGILVEQKRGIPFFISFAVVTVALVEWHTIFGSADFAEGWFSLMLFQALALAILCGAMRRRGFRLVQASNSHTASNHPSIPRLLQFNIKEFLLLMAVVAIFITISRVSLMSLQRTGYLNLSPFAFAFEALVGVLIATVLFTAIMLALGTHAFAVRLSICAATTFLIGAAVSFASSFAVELLMSRNWRMYQVQFAWLVWHQWWWLVWLLLASGFLASTLWFLRELEFRITRK